MKFFAILIDSDDKIAGSNATMVAAAASAAAVREANNDTMIVLSI
jgi:hypothetical protein